MTFLKRLFARCGSGDDQWQISIIQEVCLAMIRQVPDDWTSVSIVLEVAENGLGAGLLHSAITPEPVKNGMLGDTRFVTPEMDVFNATRKLEMGWLERKKTFKRAIITARKDEGGGWDIRSEYEHY